MRPAIAALFLVGCTPEPVPPDAGVPNGVCACTEPACIEQWIAENVGCDLCVHVTCGDGVRAGCVACEPGASPTDVDAR